MEPEAIDLILSDIEYEILKRALTEIWEVVSSSIDEGKTVDQKKFADSFEALIGVLTLLQKKKNAFNEDLIATLKEHGVLKD